MRNPPKNTPKGSFLLHCGLEHFAAVGVIF